FHHSQSMEPPPSYESITSKQVSPTGEPNEGAVEGSVSTPPPYTECSQHATVISPPVIIDLRNSETQQCSGSRNLRFKRFIPSSCALIIIVIVSTALIGVIVGWNVA
ncbi:hypothetical protein PFISCL1PPCAC_14287, partial [Pristionchus fissidentatus]